ncbi:hypothetical protein H2200_008254 [Cladophialophora chaetospira]|uniref:Uncharacterized protein n=1 Tax=Cladophialophora chaetospira TaxID=386627 RepID=A0AA39CG91_9EURO|nr:hypothetical protein H2200_008254 [Cladophialophora chaetospira]
MVHSNHESPWSSVIHNLMPVWFLWQPGDLVHTRARFGLPTYPTNVQQEVVTLSTPRTVTYYYYPKRSNTSDPSTPGYQYITVARAPKRTQAEIQTPPSTPPLSYSRTTTPILKSPSTPVNNMARGAATARAVEFAKEVDSIRAPRDDELSVMEHFAKHAGRCDYCRDPYAAWKNDRPMCSRGLSYARDVANYLYAKGGKPYSVIDRQDGDRVQVQVPYGCEAVSLLIKAIDRGMKTTPRVIVDNARRPVDSERISPVSPSRRREYHDERPRERRYINPEIIEIMPHSSRNDRRERTTYRDERREERYRSERRPKSLVYEGKGSLFPQDVEERSRRQQYERQPVVIVAEPGQRYTIRRDR